MLPPQLISTSRFGFAIFYMRCLLFVAFFCLATASANRAQENREAPPSKGLCYAFQREEDLWAVCEGKRERINIPFKASQFAISSNGTYLAYYTRKTSPIGRVLPRQELILVSLASGFKKIQKESGATTERLYGTCGTIMKYNNGKNVSTPIIEGEWSSTALARGFLQCSSDRRVIASWARANTVEVSKDPGEVIITLNGAEIHRLPKVGVNFRISPAGAFVAYGQQNGTKFQNCVLELTHSPSCTVDLDANNRSTEAVSDRGEVLYSIGTEKLCGQFACNGIEYRRPGAAKGEILEGDDSFDPQWITPQIAERLHGWASSLTSSAPQ